MDKIISGYGLPQQIAAKYMEGMEIISPTFKRHLFLYTGILFICHFAAALAAFMFQFSFVGFPFPYIPKMNAWEFMFYLPMAYIYDLGLVAIFLYLVTQEKIEVHLPWPKFFARRESMKEMRKPKIVFITFLVLVFSFFLFMFIRFRTIFFASMNNFSNPMPLLGPNASLYYSILFLAMIGCEVLGYAARFINRSRWLDLIKNMMILILLQFVWNSPVKADFAQIPGVDPRPIALTFVLIITIVVAFEFLKNLFLVTTKQFTNKR